jgi:NTE family protein
MAEEQNQVIGSESTRPQKAEDDRGWALCLSGGGFRATLFHLGSILRLNELGVLAKLSTITSVSGGSILNAVLATRWSQLTLGEDGTFTNLDEVVGGPVRAFCAHDLRTPLLLGTRLNPLNWPALLGDWFSVSANFLAEEYEPLFGQTLAQLPESRVNGPRFVFCATNVLTGACWHFHGGPMARMGDFYFGYCDAGHVRVSEAVAASSAFTLGFSALRLPLPKDCDFSRSDPWGEERVVSPKRGGEKHNHPVSPLLLTDGGVYDNLGIEPVWKKYTTLIVSDAGRAFKSVKKSGQGVISRLKRASDIGMEQMGAVRKRWFVAELESGRKTGALWTLHTLIESFPSCGAKGYGAGVRGLLHEVRTDLDPFTDDEIACLVNHGYSLADAALRSRAPALCPILDAPFRWPHEGWCEDVKLSEALQTSHRRKIWRDIGRYLTFRIPRWKPAQQNSGQGGP